MGIIKVDHKYVTQEGSVEHEKCKRKKVCIQTGYN